MRDQIISCPYVGLSGGCDDCVIGEDPMNCEAELEYEDVK